MSSDKYQSYFKRLFELVGPANSLNLDVCLDMAELLFSTKEDYNKSPAKPKSVVTSHHCFSDQ